jgi:hypothetical protein
MQNLTKTDLNNIIAKLKSQFNTDLIEYHGAYRFVLRQEYKHQISEDKFEILYKDRLFDENAVEIVLERNYNKITQFRAGVSVVGIRDNNLLEQLGLIDTSGKEILPCQFDSIKVHMEGSLELTKNGIKKLTTINHILNNEFDWDEEPEWE